MYTKAKDTSLWKAGKAIDMIQTVLEMRKESQNVDWDNFWGCMDDLLNGRDGEGTIKGLADL